MVNLKNLKAPKEQSITFNTNTESKNFLEVINKTEIEWFHNLELQGSKLLMKPTFEKLWGFPKE
jgi:hypothetical protein